MKSYRYPIQSEMSECGLACVVVCLNEFGSRVELRDLRATFGVSQRGTNVKEVAEICSAVDLVARGAVEIEAFGKIAKARIATKAAYDPENLRLKA